MNPIGEVITREPALAAQAAAAVRRDRLRTTAGAVTQYKEHAQLALKIHPLVYILPAGRKVLAHLRWMAALGMQIFLAEVSAQPELDRPEFALWGDDDDDNAVVVDTGISTALSDEDAYSIEDAIRLTEQLTPYYSSMEPLCSAARELIGCDLNRYVSAFRESRVIPNASAASQGYGNPFGAVMRRVDSALYNIAAAFASPTRQVVAPVPQVKLEAAEYFERVYGLQRFVAWCDAAIQQLATIRCTSFADILAWCEHAPLGVRVKPGERKGTTPKKPEDADSANILSARVDAEKNAVQIPDCVLGHVLDFAELIVAWQGNRLHQTMHAVAAWHRHVTSRAAPVHSSAPASSASSRDAVGPGAVYSLQSDGRYGADAGAAAAAAAANNNEGDRTPRGIASRQVSGRLVLARSVYPHRGHRTEDPRSLQGMPRVPFPKQRFLCVLPDREDAHAAAATAPIPTHHPLPLPPPSRPRGAGGKAYNAPRANPLSPAAYTHAESWLRHAISRWKAIPGFQHGDQLLDCARTFVVRTMECMQAERMRDRGSGSMNTCVIQFAQCVQRSRDKEGLRMPSAARPAFSAAAAAADEEEGDEAGEAAVQDPRSAIRASFSDCIRWYGDSYNALALAMALHLLSLGAVDIECAVPLDGAPHARDNESFALARLLSPLLTLDQSYMKFDVDAVNSPAVCVMETSYYISEQ
jgi:hypothetical protein